MALSLEGLWRVELGGSRMRFALFYLGRLFRVIFLLILLLAGIQWIANTTSIQLLVLRALPLFGLARVDGIFYVAVMPRKIQASIKKLKPMQVRNTVWLSQVESLAVATFIVGMMLWSWSQLVAPLEDVMLRLKWEYCGGKQNFVVGVNEHHGMAVGRHTVDFHNITTDHVPLAVREYAFTSHDPTHISFHGSSRDFERGLVETMATTTTTHLMCGDFDAWFLQGQGDPIPSRYGPYWWSASAVLGMPESSTCSDMEDHCQGTNSQLLRMVCGVTCGCVEPQSNVLYKVRAQGCLKRCHQDARKLHG